ncbi:MAG TPA: YccF domain-containing protein [Chloroflexota bacterium]|nr:YccF domain-containing protein [Chloroflexota bacterium]
MSQVLTSQVCSRCLVSNGPEAAFCLNCGAGLGDRRAVDARSHAQTVVVLQQDSGPGFVVRALWFVFFGWWLAFWWIGLAWLLNLTLIGLPLGLMMINRVPQVLTLHTSRRHVTVTNRGGVTVVSNSDAPQLPLWMRGLYFLLIGFWVSGLYAILAWLLCVAIITLPLGLLMFNFLPFITTLRRN